MKSRFVVAALTSTCVLLSLQSHAEQLRIPVGQESQAWSGTKPARGMTKGDVESQFGTPNSTNGPNGSPPIYYWEYTDFTVYFEGDYVIHSVVKTRTKNNK